MFYSNYLPVNVKRANAAVYTEAGVYPANLLALAKQALTCNDNANGQVVLRDDGYITFTEHSEHTWPIPDVYMACEAMDMAEKNNFSYYAILDSSGIPQLFVSKAFKSSRILVNALTMQTVLVTKTNLVRKISCMIDKRFSSSYCLNLFQVISNLEKGATKYLDALILDRGTQDETLMVSPVTTMYSDVTDMYGADLIDEFRQILSGEVTETDSVQAVEGGITRNELSYWGVMSMEHIKLMCSTYDKLLAKKSNYLSLSDENYNFCYFISTNWRYLVNAKTFECLTIKNVNFRSLLQTYAASDTTPASDLNMLWMLAKTENN